MLTRGTIERCAIVCVPRIVDLRRNVRQLAALDAQPVHTEPIRPDAGETERRRLRAEHVRLLKRLRGRRVRAKRRQQEHAEKRVLIAPPKTAQLVREQLQRMRALWLPDVLAESNASGGDVVKRVRGQCSREVLGYVTQANFCLSEGQVAGVAYVTLMGLKALRAASEKASAANNGGGGQQQQQHGRKRKSCGGRVGAASQTPACRVIVRSTTSRHYRLASLRVCI